MDLILFTKEGAFEVIQEEWFVPTITLKRSLAHNVEHELHEKGTKW